MKNKITLMSVLVMLGLFTSTSAIAGPFYNIAKNAARGLAQSAWDSIGRDCTNTTEFVRIVGDGVDDATYMIGTVYRGPSAEDFGRGYIDGLVEVMEQVVNHCVNECNMLGNAMGEWAGKMFCRVAEAIGRMPEFTSRIVNIRGTICGGSYRMGCESKFVGVVTGMCLKYTTPSSALMNYYRGAGNGCCAYNPY